MANDIRRWIGPKVSWHLSYGWRQNPGKNLNRENWPNGESNPGPLRDKRACYYSQLFIRWMIIILNLYFKARQHLRSLAPVMKWWWMIMMAKWYSGTLGLKASWHLSYRWGKTPKKTSPRKLVPTGDRTRARCVTSAHATTCSTAVDRAW